jgi:hypothetical protein
VISRPVPSGACKKRRKPPRQNDRSEKDEICRGKSLKANCGTCAKKSN